MAAPVQLAAIDAGSNAIRLAIARATSPQHIEILESERAAVRLGHNAFTRRMLDEKTIARAVRAFRSFREAMDRHQVTAYRAVATAAAREARNSRKLLERIRRKTGIEVDVITGEEEAQFVCNAVHWALGKAVQPRVIFDLGGGSLELNFFQRGQLQRRIGLPLGTIRLMETYKIEGVIDEDKRRRLRHHIFALLRSALPSAPKLTREAGVACGGNAEALVRIAPGPNAGRIPTINTRLLKDQTWKLQNLDVAGRMRVFRIRQDRAEVIAIAAIIFSALSEWLDLRSLLVPGVGVREGVLLELVAEQYSATAESEEDMRRDAELVESARWFARRMGYNEGHAGQVARLALSLFDQLRPLHEMNCDMRVLLEIGATLHDVGHFVNRKSHQRHGEYLIRNADIPGLRGWRRDVVGALVRYHNTKSEPELAHASYAALDGDHRRQVRILASLLRIAERLESEHEERVTGVDVRIEGRKAIFMVAAADGTRLDVAGLERKAKLFETEFHLKPEFRRDQRKAKVA
ncbi:MAG TPA: HD domain-containing protein [Candidatus Aquilonibacter sp.]|nr:HD domain-containing protein [Candidatus Aquilonibacter sp.]